MKSTFFFEKEPHTPKSIKSLIWITVLFSFLAPLLTYWMQKTFQMEGPLFWLSLSAQGIKNGWAWQPLTYFFIYSAGTSITLSFLIGLFFNMLLLWFTGIEIERRYGNRNFLLFYLGAGLSSALLTLPLLFAFSQNAIVIGNSPPIFSLIILWTMLHPETEFFFFFVIKIKAKWLSTLYLGIMLLSALSSGDTFLFFAEFFGILWGFCIGRFVWKLPNPYPLNLELPSFIRKKKKNLGKIIDISAFYEDDDQFMDRMLEKIAKGEHEKLTKKEKERMQKISERKKSHFHK